MANKSTPVGGTEQRAQRLLDLLNSELAMPNPTGLLMIAVYDGKQWTQVVYTENAGTADAALLGALNHYPEGSPARQGMHQARLAWNRLVTFAGIARPRHGNSPDKPMEV